MAHVFNGILNDNKREIKIKLVLLFVFNVPTVMDLFINDRKVDVKMNAEKIIINDIEYDYTIKKTDNEIIIAGMEIENICHYLIPCLVRQRFFVLTNAGENPVNL